MSTTNPHTTGFLQVLAFPITTLVAFWVNHHLLDIFQRPRWRVVKGRSREYVRRIVAGGRTLGGCMAGGCKIGSVICDRSRRTVRSILSETL